MAKRGIKETLLSTLVHGEEVLNNVDVMRAIKLVLHQQILQVKDFIQKNCH